MNRIWSSEVGITAPLLTLRLWVSHLTSMSLSFHISKMEVLLSTQGFIVKIKGDNKYKLLSIEPSPEMFDKY